MCKDGHSIFMPSYQKTPKTDDHIRVYNRHTGELVDEKIAAYVKLGMEILFHHSLTIRLDETKWMKEMFAYMSRKEGLHFDSPKTVGNIKPFITYFGINTHEFAESETSFKNFNQFFYRKLRPVYRPISSYEDPVQWHLFWADGSQKVIVSPADCRCTVFPTVSKATELWIKGRNFTVSTLLKDDKMVGI